ncbi:phosphate transport system permease protein [Tepidimonas ignava]|uniref:Phosphate transport system permease protein n=1 Tax=Tepidimonas ignava TaxID=114249 RepID=A0A4R3LCM9_9BURK|nr:ABC transporter permease subunit [Tepidimonas ignava]TCS97649.1 phosphate transport system permease protein [Tepidimonas ignava]TSE24076.1 Phosphate transport system permease protein PstC [Tepidimonas ignava]
MNDNPNAAANARSLTVLSVDRAMGRRLWTDRWFKYLMTIGGLGVIVAISAIFFYLASVVVPLFTPPKVDAQTSYPAPGNAQQPAVLLQADERLEALVRAQADGRVVFADFASGQPQAEVVLPLPASSAVRSSAAADRAVSVMALGLDDGRALVAKVGFKTSFDAEARRIIEPQVEYPVGEQPVAIDPQQRPLVKLAVQHSADGTTLAALTDDGRLWVSGLAVERNPITGEEKVQSSAAEIQPAPPSVRDVLIEFKQRELFVLSGDRELWRYDISDKSAPQLLEKVQLVGANERVTALTMLSGGFSIIVGTDRGNVAQWFPVREEGTRFKLTHIRDFKPMPAAVTVLEPEYHRKGFMAGDAKGNLGSYFATSKRLLFQRPLSDQPLVRLGYPPRGNAYIAQDAAGRLHVARVHNEYPEVSFYAVWQKVWYESYEEPAYVWQSSAANANFEPKFSLTPLTYGTLKAAFYAMIVAVPLALLGAIYTAYFMSPKIRGAIKPTIEVMQALPTVVLGFLAGLWLAPFVENNLAGVLLTIATFPLAFFAAAWLFALLPEAVRLRVPPGWEAAWLVPVVVLQVWLCLTLGHPIEAALFGGDMPNWLSNVAGIKFEQRNSLVVGIAMGFAVTPTIFSIAEDAIFSVPKHLTTGSLALGATPWQTLTRVVLLTASPGIFSAIMIGLGRAVGETMIVLMATGNTAVMDWSIFTGFRTLSANIGVEMPEAGVGETHYRLLFLSALVLFAFTFVVNTLAELVRQRLRERYQTI